MTADLATESERPLRGPVVWTTVMTVLALVVAVVTYVGTCLGQQSDSAAPIGYLWSPKARFCALGEGSSTAPWMYLSLLIPVVALALAVYLRKRGVRRALSRVALALAILGPIAPPVYAAALPSYQEDSYPIFTRPWLRPASSTHLARVCYSYGVVSAAATESPEPDTAMRCVDLQRNSASESLTTSYDEGQTSYNLQFFGNSLTQHGWPTPAGFSGFAGLVVARSYELSFSQARQGANEED
jgi:hypothetical protein